jgi:hypothetical protein
MSVLEPPLGQRLRSRRPIKRAEVLKDLAHSESVVMHHPVPAGSRRLCRVTDRLMNE